MKAQVWTSMVRVMEIQIAGTASDITVRRWFCKSDTFGFKCWPCSPPLGTTSSSRAYCPSYFQVGWESMKTMTQQNDPPTRQKDSEDRLTWNFAHEGCSKGLTDYSFKTVLNVTTSDEVTVLCLHFRVHVFETTYLKWYYKWLWLLSVNRKDSGCFFFILTILSAWSQWTNTVSLRSFWAPGLGCRKVKLLSS